MYKYPIPTCHSSKSTHHPVEVRQSVPWEMPFCGVRTTTSAHRNGHVDAQVAIVGKQVSNGGVKDEAVAVHDRRSYTVMNRPWCSFPGEPSAVAVQLETVGEVLCLFASAYEEHNRKELLMAFIFLLLLQHQHEMVAEAGLHHDPVHRTGQVNVCCQEDDVLPLQCSDGFVGVHEVGHDCFQGALPFAGSARARAGVWAELANLLMLRLLTVVQRQQATRRGILQRGRKRQQIRTGMT